MKLEDIKKGMIVYLTITHQRMSVMRIESGKVLCSYSDKKGNIKDHYFEPEQLTYVEPPPLYTMVETRL